MGLITGALQIGKSALLAYQSALQVVGNNVANSAAPGYARQTAVLQPTLGGPIPEGFLPGGGVAMAQLQREVDNALQDRLRTATGNQAGTLVEQQALGRIESSMNELTEDGGLSILLQKFFNSFSALQAEPQDQSLRSMVLTAGNSVVQEVQRQRQDAIGLRDDLNKDLAAAATRVNQILQDVAGLNVRITAAESSAGGGANSLRDQRDELLAELGEYMQIDIREQPDGGVNIYIGNEQAVQGGISRGITTTLETTEDQQPQVVVRYADNNGPVSIRSGKMAGLIRSRDEHALGQIASLNNLADTLIQEVNKVHAQGQGLDAFAHVISSYDVLDADAALNSDDAGLALRPQNGSFLITVSDRSAGTSLTTTVQVDLDGIGADASLNSLVAQINANVANVTATATADHRLQLIAGNGFEYTFSQDSSNVLASLGINTFFTGQDAEDLAVNAELLANPSLLAAAKQPTEGDGTNAGDLAALATTPLSALNGQSLLEYYNSLASAVAIKGSAAQSSTTAADAIVSSLSAQRESISGVNLDEETVAMLRFQRSYQAAAQYTSVVDQLIEQMLAIVQ